MASGNYALCYVFREDYGPDDEVGGSTPTGTLVYEGVAIAFQETAPNEMLHQQGIEVQKMAKALLQSPIPLVIKEEDQIEIYFPAYHPQLNQRWKITNVIHAQSPRSRRKTQMRLRLARMEYHRKRQL